MLRNKILNINQQNGECLFERCQGMQVRLKSVNEIVPRVERYKASVGVRPSKINDQQLKLRFLTLFEYLLQGGKDIS